MLVDPRNSGVGLIRIGVVPGRVLLRRTGFRRLPVLHCLLLLQVGVGAGAIVVIRRRFLMGTFPLLGAEMLQLLG